jgi:hypothetical protein
LTSLPGGFKNKMMDLGEIYGSGGESGGIAQKKGHSAVGSVGDNPTHSVPKTTPRYAATHSQAAFASILPSQLSKARATRDILHFRRYLWEPAHRTMQSLHGCGSLKVH